METIEEQSKCEMFITTLPTRICLVGNVGQDADTLLAAESFGLPVITSDSGLDTADDKEWRTFYVMGDFEGDNFQALHKQKECILGPPALKYAAEMKQTLGHNSRPIYNYAMRGVVTCFTGIRKKDELTKLVHLIHSMGGCIKKDMNPKTTHLICSHSGGAKYQYAKTFRMSVVRPDWVYAAWTDRDNVQFEATQDGFTKNHRLKAFEGQKVCFFGFPAEEHQHMVDVLLENGGVCADLDDPECSHVVMPNTGAVLTSTSSSTDTNPSTSTSTSTGLGSLTNPQPQPHPQPQPQPLPTTPTTSVGGEPRSLQTPTTSLGSARAAGGAANEDEPMDEAEIDSAGGVGGRMARALEQALEEKENERQPKEDDDEEDIFFDERLFVETAPVVDEHTTVAKPDTKSNNTHILKSDWFWYTIQNGYANEMDYLFGDYLDSITNTPNTDRRDSLPVSFNKRKRKRLSQRIQLEGTPLGSGKRRSSVSDAGLLSVSNSLFDCTTSPDKLLDSDDKLLLHSEPEPIDGTPVKRSMRFNHFMDFFTTESNYVGILDTILNVGRAFSFNKTPNKLKRAVSTMMTSPFGSTNSLTPSSQLAQMRLAANSCRNINEVADEDDCSSMRSSSPSTQSETLVVPPMSVQPTRKSKAGVGVSVGRI
ncbi:GL17822 [Drosophila persimilis]|uniref:GL17822 n=1 Tax=Drosophila persimilis TaxID=7234 RepID=B4H2B2_DROPE|nr:GL17822 [Drosophila persimilis]